MESLLTSTAEILVIGFALLMALDFFSGLVHLYRSVPLQTQPHDEPETESVMPEEYAPTKNSDILTAPLNQSTIGRRDINVDEGAVKMSGFIVTLMGITSQPEPKQEPQPQPLSLVTTGRDVVEFVGDKPATLDWLETAIKPDILDATETPNVIEMARLSLPLVQVFGGGQSERDLTRLGIRELKKRASAAKIKRYNMMTKTQLIDQLAALDQLSA